MADDINIVNIKLTATGKPDVVTQLQFSNSQLTISDDLVMPILKKAGLENVSSCSITLGANNIALNIENYTVSDTIYIDNFYNMPSCISILQAKGVNIHIVKQRIDLLQADCQSILLADCQINQLDIGLAENSRLLQKKSASNDDIMPTAYSMKSVDIRHCNISTLKAYIACDSINIQESNIETFNLHGGFGSKAVTEIKQMNIWHYTTIKSSEIYCTISDFKLQESSVLNLVAKAYCSLGKMCIEDSTILNAHNFEKKHFIRLDTNAWLLIGKSAENDRNLGTKAEAYYQISKEIHRQEKGINKVAGKLFGFCSGYGYKPIRSLIACGIMSIVAALILTIKDFICLGLSATTKIAQNLHTSIAAIVGQSGLAIADGLNFWIATIEYIGAIILFAVFVNALYVRYKD